MCAKISNGPVLLPQARKTEVMVLITAASLIIGGAYIRANAFIDLASCLVCVPFDLIDRFGP
jgi:hypothetical protein